MSQRRWRECEEQQVSDGHSRIVAGTTTDRLETLRVEAVTVVGSRRSCRVHRPAESRGTRGDRQVSAATFPRDNTNSPLSEEYVRFLESSGLDELKQLFHIVV